MSRIVIAGSTGLVGRIALAKVLDDPRVTLAIAPTRGPLPPHPKLVNPIVDYEALPAEADWWRCDAVVCALGTTLAKAGSAEAFYRIDHDYPLMVASAARAQGAQTFALVSAIGADAGSNLLYNRTKGKVEASIGALDYPSYTIVRPGLIGGKRDEFRAMERVSDALLTVLGPVLPRQWRISPAENIAKALIDAALAADRGKYIISAAQLA